MKSGPFFLMGDQLLSIESSNYFCFEFPEPCGDCQLENKVPGTAFSDFRLRATLECFEKFSPRISFTIYNNLMEFSLNANPWNTIAVETMPIGAQKHFQKSIRPHSLLLENLKKNLSLSFKLCTQEASTFPLLT